VRDPAGPAANGRRALSRRRRPSHRDRTIPALRCRQRYVRRRNNGWLQEHLDQTVTVADPPPLADRSAMTEVRCPPRVARGHHALCQWLLQAAPAGAHTSAGEQRFWRCEAAVAKRSGFGDACAPAQALRPRVRTTTRPIGTLSGRPAAIEINSSGAPRPPRKIRVENFWGGCRIEL